MTNHLATKHPDIKNSDRKKEETQKESNQAANPFELAQIQTHIKLEKTTPYSKKHVKLTKTLSMVCDWIAECCLPLQTACSPQFLEILRHLDPKLPHINEKDVKANILEKLMQVVEYLKARLPVRVASTIDFWSQLDRKGFGTVTVHWITSDWSLEQAVLGAKSLDCVIGVHDDDHEWEVPGEDAANVAQFYIGLLEEFKCTAHYNTTHSPSAMESFRRLLQQGSYFTRSY